MYRGLTAYNLTKLKMLMDKAGHTVELMESVYKLQQDEIQTDTMFICLDGHVMGMQHYCQLKMWC